MQRLPLNKFITSPPLLAGGGLLIFLVWLVYGQVLHFDFTNYDDPHYVFENPNVRDGFSFQGFLWGLSTSYYDFWHPLTWWSHMLDCELFGLRPGMHHLVNAGFHLANSLLLFGILTRLTGAWLRCLFVAMIFALHPMHVESVAWVAERKDVLSTFFLLMSLGAYLGYVRSAPGDPVRARLYIGSLLAFALGLMAKAMIVTLPFVLLLLDFWPLGRMTVGQSGSSHLKSLVREKWPFFALAFASALVTYLTMKNGGDLEAAEKVPLGLRLSNLPISYLSYVIKLAYPHNLTAFYPLPPAWPVGKVLLSVLFLLVVTFIVWRWMAARPWWFFGWFFFLGTLVPVIGIVANGFHAIADRYTYIPSIGLFIAVVWTVAEEAKTRAFRAGAIMIAAVVIGVLAVLSHRQVRVWQNSGTLWTDCLSKTKDNATAYCNLGFYYRNAGETNLAISCYEKAVQLRPDIFEINLNLGAVFLDSGQPRKATNYYARALVLMPDSPLVNLDLGVAEMRADDFPAAVSQLKRAAELNPRLVRPLFLRGLAFAGLNQLTNAIDCYQRALLLEPANPQVLYGLGVAQLKSGDYDRAIASLGAAVNSRPGWDLANYQLAQACLDRQELKPAMAAYQQVIAVNPFHLPALNGLAWLLATCPDPQLRNGGQAVELARRACDQTSYTNIDYVTTLGAAYAEAGRLSDAVQTAREACAAARLTGQASVLARNQQLLELYQSGQPCRDATLRGQD